MKPLFIMVMLSFICGCSGPMAIKKPQVSGGGEVYIYMEQFPQDADRLAFTLGGISAVRNDGVEIPLSLKITEFKASSIRRQRLVAVGELPAGEYTGLSYQVARASLASEEGDSALLVPEKPVNGAIAFSVTGKQATVISLAFRFRESVQSGFRFDPSFALQIPNNPLPALTGYVTNEGSDSVSVFDKRAARVARVISTGRNPAGIVIDQVQRKAYVAVSGDDAVEVIDVNRNEIVSRIRLHPGDEPRELALTPDGRTLVAVNIGSNTVSFIDPGSLDELSRVNVGNRPASLVMDRTGRRAYVFNTLSNTVSVVDVATRTVSATIATDSGPFRGALNRRGDRLVICHTASPNLTMLNTVTLTAGTKVYAGVGAGAVKVNPSTDLLYVGYRTGGRIDIFDPYSHIPIDFVASAEGIAAMTIDGDENTLVIVRPRSGTVQLVNLVSRKEAALIDVGEKPYGIALFGER